MFVDSLLYVTSIVCWSCVFELCFVMHYFVKLQALQVKTRKGKLVDLL